MMGATLFVTLSAEDKFFLLGMLSFIHYVCNAFSPTVILNQRRQNIRIRRFFATTTAIENSSYDFFTSIGRPRFISAPMVDQSSLSWRLLVKKNGADLAFSQMMHAKNFQTVKKYRAECIDWDNYRHSSGSIDKEVEATMLDKPLIVQLCGNDPNLLVAAGKIVHKDVAAIDLNLGCPQKIAKKGNYGAYLLPNKDLIVRCLSAMVSQLDCPITAKIRKLPNDEDTINLALAIENCGVKMLTVHGRTASDSKLFIGPADWVYTRTNSVCM
jgi:tRNA-dihydrouridine synthase 1